MNRNTADPTIALLCRELVVLNRLVADNEARRDARLEEKLAEIDARLAERPAPRPLDIPRNRGRADAGPVERLRESFETELERD
jgi:hypothetical protein